MESLKYWLPFWHSTQGRKILFLFLSYLKQLCCYVEVPETSWSFHCWQPVSRWRLHRWLAKAENLAMSALTPNKTGTHHTDTKINGKQGVQRREEKNMLHAPHIMLLPPARPINKCHGPKHAEFHVCASIPKPLTTVGCSCSQQFTWLNFILPDFVLVSQSQPLQKCHC